MDWMEMEDIGKEPLPERDEPEERGGEPGLDEISEMEDLGKEPLPSDSK